MAIIRYDDQPRIIPHIAAVSMAVGGLTLTLGSMICLALIYSQHYTHISIPFLTAHRRTCLRVFEVVGPVFMYQAANSRSFMNKHLFEEP